MSALEDWADAVCRELGLTDVDRGRGTLDLILDVARDAAHNVARPAAPLTTYLLGIAVGRADGPGAAADLAARVARLAVDWPSGEVPDAQSDRDATLRRNRPPESDQERL